MANITMRNIYDELKETLLLSWVDDDYMDQETLFKLQDKIADLTLKVALRCGEGKDLVATFPWLYHINTVD